MVAAEAGARLSTPASVIVAIYLQQARRLALMSYMSELLLKIHFQRRNILSIYLRATK